MRRLLLVWMVMLFSPWVMADAGKDMIPRLTQLDTSIFRGGQPTPEGYAMLKEKGIRTIVNFRHEKEWIESGRAESEKHGFEYVSLPWAIYAKASEDVLPQFIELIEDSTNYPVYFHCRRGVERTGVMTVFYAMKFKGMSFKEAYSYAFDGYPLKWIWKPFVKKRLKQFKQQLRLN